MPRAYDLIGNVTAPAEIFPRLDALAAMIDTLRELGLHDAADETADLLDESRAFAAILEARTSRLRRIWKAVEAAAGPVTDPGEAMVRVTAAALEYRDHTQSQRS